MWVSYPELVSILGDDMALVLTRGKGGIKFYVPRQASPDHWLAKLVGVDGMEALCAAYPGEDIVVPNGRREHCKAKVLQLLDEGLTKAEIAEQCGVTDRYVYIVSSATAGAKQLPLPIKSADPLVDHPETK
jgi:DNA-binding NarL/FixJ family response regulator